jgi:hypothetical protein
VLTEACDRSHNSLHAIPAEYRRLHVEDRHYPSLFVEAWGFLPSEANVRWFKGLSPWRKRDHVEEMLDMVYAKKDRKENA